jgi:hypothetical protein
MSRVPLATGKLDARDRHDVPVLADRKEVMTMLSQADREQLARATEQLLEVIARHRGEDLRAISILTEAIHSIRTGSRYLADFNPPAENVA